MVILGDFNLNETMKFSNDYSHKHYYNELNFAFDPLGLIQLVDFNTWRRLVNGSWRNSILDHVYTDDITNVSNLEPIDTVIGDHSLIIMNLENEGKLDPVISYPRDWSKYSKEKLLNKLNEVEMEWQFEDVQSNWNNIFSLL